MRHCSVIPWAWLHVVCILVNTFHNRASSIQIVWVKMDMGRWMAKIRRGFVKIWVTPVLACYYTCHLVCIRCVFPAETIAFVGSQNPSSRNWTNIFQDSAVINLSAVAELTSRMPAYRMLKYPLKCATAGTNIRFTLQCLFRHVLVGDSWFNSLNTMPVTRESLSDIRIYIHWKTVFI